MNRYVTKTKVVDFEELGYETMLQSGNLEQARNICALHIHAYADEMQPELTSLQSGIRENKNHGAALHAHLYDRPIPVNDASMLTSVLRWRLLLTLMVFAGVACFAGNTVTFYLFGFGLFLTILLAAGTTALPLVIGHLAYERIIAKHRSLQIGIIAIAVVLCFVGLYELAAARQVMVDKQAVEASASISYVDGAPADPAGGQDSKPESGTETRVRQTLGGAMLLIMIAADLMLGLLAGLLSRMHTDEDYAAWRKLKKITRVIARLEERVSQLTSFVEIAKKRCSAGILRAQVVLNKRKIPYYRALNTVIICVLFGVSSSRAQSTVRHEAILIDSSISIAKAATNNNLFREYLIATRKLLLSEPPNSRVWVSSIATNSFGGAGEILRGWTPDSRGVFTDNLDRARNELSAAFEQKAAKLSPVTSGTDIFGALWRFKSVSDSHPTPENDLHSNTIWMFSDMVNETREFPMRKLITAGPAAMLARAKASGLLVPLSGHRIFVYGAATGGLTPQSWNTIKAFWTLYFKAAGAELVAYSAECDPQR